MKSPGVFWYDIPFCDAEVIYAANFNNGVVDAEFKSDSIKDCPLKIHAIEVYAQ